MQLPYRQFFTSCVPKHKALESTMEEQNTAASLIVFCMGLQISGSSWSRICQSMPICVLHAVGPMVLANRRLQKPLRSLK